MKPQKEKPYREMKLSGDPSHLPYWLNAYEGRVRKVYWKKGNWYIQINRAEKEIIAPST